MILAQIKFTVTTITIEMSKSGKESCFWAMCTEFIPLEIS